MNFLCSCRKVLLCHAAQKYVPSSVGLIFVMLKMQELSETISKDIRVL